jgi:hypothetical protein
VHQLSALFAGIEEAAIDDAEAESLAQAILDVAKRRKLKPNKELLAWGNFATVLLSLYVPRAIAFLARHHAMKVARQQSEANAAEVSPELVARMPVTSPAN